MIHEVSVDLFCPKKYANKIFFTQTTPFFKLTVNLSILAFKKSHRFVAICCVLTLQAHCAVYRNFVNFWVYKWFCNAFETKANEWSTNKVYIRTDDRAVKQSFCEIAKSKWITFFRHEVNKNDLLSSWHRIKSCSNLEKSSTHIGPNLYRLDCYTYIQ